MTKLDQDALTAARKAYAKRWTPNDTAEFSSQASAQVDYIIRAYVEALPKAADHSPQPASGEGEPVAWRKRDTYAGSDEPFWEYQDADAVDDPTPAYWIGSGYKPLYDHSQPSDKDWVDGLERENVQWRKAALNEQDTAARLQRELTYARDAESDAKDRVAELERELAEAKDQGVNFVFDALARALGLDVWVVEDGSETWDGDVRATLMRILRDSGAIDPETDVPAAAEIARLKAQTAGE